MAFAALKGREIGRDTMSALRGYVGKEVVVEYAKEGRVHTAKGILAKVKDFGIVELQVNRDGTRGYDGIQLLGFRTAIRCISSGSATLYNNIPNVPTGYRSDTVEALHRARIASFGEKVAGELQAEDMRIEELARLA